MVQHMQIDYCDTLRKWNKDQNYVIISIDTGKALDKIQWPFRINTLNQMGIEGKHLHIIKDICDKPSATMIINGETVKPFALHSGTWQVCPLSTPASQHSIGSHRAIMHEKKIKGIQIGKEKVKLSLFADDMMLYRENPKTPWKRYKKQ